MHINIFEIKAAFIGIRTYWHNKSYKHIRVMSDSSTATAYINNKADIKSKNTMKLQEKSMAMVF